MRRRFLPRGVLRTGLPPGGSGPHSAGTLPGQLALPALSPEDVSQLLEGWRLAAVGQLAAGVAHEVNNPLFAILGTIEFMLEDAPPGSELRARLERIQSSGQEIRETVRALVEFAREPTADRRVFSLSAACAQTAQLVRRSSLAKGITITEAYPEDPVAVEAAPSQVKQILLALITNAQQVQPGGGRIELEVAREDGAVVHVRDAGPGIAYETLEQVFEPFFTTRRAAGGSGLGLTVALALAELQGGGIEVESEVGQGSTFSLRLPLVAV
jgi:two-component system NtrC family sensor kinase